MARYPTRIMSYFRHVMRLKGQEKTLKGKGNTSYAIKTERIKE